MTPNSASAEKYIFYLHGAIMEGQSGNAKTSSGEYEYDQILESFRKAGFTVKSEIRKSGTNISAYAKQVTEEINGLLKNGVSPGNITVIGASKGALIAMHVSTFLKNEGINFVFIAACNDGNFQSFPEIRFHGNILSIYDKSDGIGESCLQFKNRSGGGVKQYKEVAVDTGLGHQFLWSPMQEWITPSIEWAKSKY